MNLAPALTAPLEIQIHLASILPAALIGLWLLMFSVKGKRAHRVLGYTYLVLMSIAAFTAYFIRSSADQSFSWIHLFIPLTLYGVVGGLYAARTHNVARHKRAMVGLFIGAMVLAGGFTLLPGRLMHTLLAGG